MWKWKTGEQIRVYSRNFLTSKEIIENERVKREREFIAKTQDDYNFIICSDCQSGTTCKYAAS